MNLALGSKVPRFASAILAALWLAIAGFRMLALLLQLVRIQKLKEGALPPGPALQERFQRLVGRLGLTRKVELKVSPAHPSSFLLGFVRPVILLPVESRMEPGEADLVLRHELAHAERRDDWANLVQHSILALCFFHPAVWWISKQLSLEREIACDDHVLQQSRQPHAYALLLATLAARMQRGLPLLAPGSSNHKTQLKQRIDMILNTHRNASPRLVRTWLALITSVAALVAAAIICSAPRIVLAQNATAPAETDSPSAAASTHGIAAVAVASDPLDADWEDAKPRVPRAPGAAVSGPKSKPGSPTEVRARTAVIVAPAVPAAPAAASVVGAPPAPVAVSDVLPPPVPSPYLAAVQAVPEPRGPRPGPAARDSSLEQRLERLEQMVESLMNQWSLKPGHSDFHLKGSAGKDNMIDRKEIEQFAKHHEQLAKHHAELTRKHVTDSREIERMKQQAEREAARAVEQAKRATWEADKALKGEHKVQTLRKSKDGSQKQLEALRKQLETLEREREKLDRQIERLENEQELLDEQFEGELDLQLDLELDLQLEQPEQPEQLQQLQQPQQDQASSDTQPEVSKAECEVTKPALR